MRFFDDMPAMPEPRNRLIPAAAEASPFVDYIDGEAEHALELAEIARPIRRELGRQDRLRPWPYREWESLCTDLGGEAGGA